MTFEHVAVLIYWGSFLWGARHTWGIYTTHRLASKRLSRTQRLITWGFTVAAAAVTFIAFYVGLLASVRLIFGATFVRWTPPLSLTIAIGFFAIPWYLDRLLDRIAGLRD